MNREDAGLSLRILGVLMLAVGLGTLIWSDWSAVVGRREIPNWAFGLVSAFGGVLVTVKGIRILRRPSD
jgi:hypothetical protein